MERGSSKQGPRVDEELEHETESITRSGQPPRAEEGRDTEPFDEGHLILPDKHEPGPPPGMTPSDIERRSDIPRSCPPHRFPADREGLLGALQRTDAPDE